jgi:hypothetical protein
MQWRKEKEQKDEHWVIKHQTEIKDQTTRNPLITGRLRIAVPAPLVTPVVLLLNDTNIFWYGNRVEHLYA